MMLSQYLSDRGQFSAAMPVTVITYVPYLAVKSLKLAMVAEVSAAKRLLEKISTSESLMLLDSMVFWKILSFYVNGWLMVSMDDLSAQEVSKSTAHVAIEVVMFFA